MVEPVESPESPESVETGPKHRRVTTPPPDGSDPTPSSEPPRHRLDENDDRLNAEKPPHY
ncbi:MAG: hypothetical protein AB7K08_06790 [Microbacteriaceae bacterium]